MAVWNSKGSRCKLRRGEGITKSQAAAWGDETDSRRALADNDDVIIMFIIGLVSNTPCRQKDLSSSGGYRNKAMGGAVILEGRHISEA